MIMKGQHSIHERYHRQVILKGFGESGQKKLLDSRVLAIGAGGLGCPCLLYLAGAGIGTIGIIDHDRVSLTNLHRQVLFRMEDIGQSKASVAALRLATLNDQVTFEAYDMRLDTGNCLEVFSAYDIIIDGTDNFATRYLVNDACLLLNKPLVYGAVSQYEGQVAVFGRGISYRDLFPVPAAAGEILNCAEAGVLGVLPGIIGSLQAAETIKLITGIGEPLLNRMLTYNALNNQSYEVEISPDPLAGSLVPDTAEAFRNTDYALQCGMPSTAMEIDPITFNRMLQSGDITVIDVRETGETPLIREFHHLHVPLGKIREKLPSLGTGIVVFVCQSGKRSLQAAQWLRERRGNHREVFSLQGGILNWQALSK